MLFGLVKRGGLLIPVVPWPLRCDIFEPFLSHWASALNSVALLSL